MRHFTAYLELTAAMVIFGSAIIAGKVIVGSFPVMLGAGASSAISLSILLPQFLVTQGWRFPSRRDVMVLFLQAAIGSFLWRTFVFQGLKLTTAVEGGIITSTTPAVIGLISFLFLKEHPTWARAAGIALSVVGILAINVVGVEGAERGPDPMLGNLLVFGSVLCDSVFTIFGKFVAGRVTPLTIATLVNLFGLILFTPFALLEASAFDFAAVPPIGWGALIYFGTAVSWLSFVLWFRGVAKVSASTAGVFTAIMPVSAVALSYLFLREPFAWSHLVGLLCVLAGIYLITRGEAGGRASSAIPQNPA